MTADTESSEFLSRVVRYLTEHRREIAQVWKKGRVAHVAFELTPGIRESLEVSPDVIVWTMPRARERKAAELADAATARFVKGRLPGRVWLWAHNGGSLLMMDWDLTGKWRIVPGSTDAERARGPS